MNSGKKRSGLQTGHSSGEGDFMMDARTIKKGSGRLLRVAAVREASCWLSWRRGMRGSNKARSPWSGSKDLRVFWGFSG